MNRNRRCVSSITPSVVVMVLQVTLQTDVNAVPVPFTIKNSVYITYIALAR